MPILVTGGTGFLGVNLVRLLVARGQRVRVLVRSTSVRKGLDSPLIEFAVGDVTDAESMHKAVSGCEEVYHLAAWVQISSWGYDVAHRVNVQGTRNVCEAALRAGVRRLMHTSSIATVAGGTLERPADESTPWGEGEPATPYYRTKRESEWEVLAFIRRGLDAVIVNPTYLVGPWDIKPSAGRLVIQVARRRIPGCPSRGGINFVDVRSAAAGHVLAMERGDTGQRYILGGENLPYRVFAERVAAVAGVSAPPLTLPYGVLYPLAALGSLGGRLFPNALRDANLSVLHSAFLEHYVTSAKAEGGIGYLTYGVTEAIEDAIIWFVDNGYMPPPPRMSEIRIRRTDGVPPASSGCEHGLKARATTSATDG